MSKSNAAGHVAYDAETLKIMQEIDKYLEGFSSDDTNIPEKSVTIKDEPLDNHDTVAFDAITPNQNVYKQFTKNSTVMAKKNTNNPLDNFSFALDKIGNIQEDVIQKANVYKKLKTMDKKNTSSPIDNFSFDLDKIGNIQEGVIQKANVNKQFTKNSTAMEKKNTNNPIDNFSFALDKIGNIQDHSSTFESIMGKYEKFEYSVPESTGLNTPNYEQIANQKNLNTSSNKNNSGFQKEFPRPFQRNAQNNSPSSLLSKDNDYPLISPLTQPSSSKLFSPLFEDFKQQPKKVQGKYQLGHNELFGLNNNELNNSNIGNHKQVFKYRFQVPYPPSTNRSPEEDINGSLNSNDQNRRVQNKQHFNLPDHKFKQRVNLSHYGNKQNLNVPRLENKKNFNSPHHENTPILNSPCHENKQNSGCTHSDSSSMPIRQNHFNVSNLQSPETSHTHANNNAYLHVIKDNLCPESLNGSTIEFSSRKLVNSSTRDELVIAMNTYGALDFSWWTPNDMFFVRYISSYDAQHVYQIYTK